MTNAALDNQLHQYWPLLAKEEKQTVLAFIKSIIRQKQNPPQRLTFEEYNKELEEAEARIDAGFFTTLEDVIKESESW